MDLATVNTRFAFPLQNLLTLACDHPNSVTDWSVDISSTVGNQLAVRMPRVLTDSDAEEISPHRLIFHFSHVRDRFQTVVAKWLDLSRQFGEVCGLYFGIQYSPRTFLDLQFQTVLQALTLYAGRRGKLAELPRVAEIEDVMQQLSVEQQLRLDRVLRGNQTIAAGAALAALLDKHWQIFEPLAGSTPEMFVNRTLNTLHYIEQRDPVDALAASLGAELYIHTQQLSWLMKLCFLEELGFSASEREDLLAGNQAADFIRTEAARAKAKRATVAGAGGSR
jgi:hypothetical protein